MALIDIITIAGSLDPSPFWLKGLYFVRYRVFAFFLHMLLFFLILALRME